MMSPKHFAGRRSVIRSLASASMLLPGMLHEMMGAETAPGAAKFEDPLAPKQPMFPAKAKRVIFLFMPGGGSLHPASHETVDQKMHYVRQEGAQVFKYAVRRMADLACEMLDRGVHRR